MYKDYFGLHHSPFKITPDTRLFFPGANRGAVLQALIYAVVNGEGITKVVGEVGSGKTMLCRMLEDGVPDDVEVVYLANPSLTPDNLLHAIGFEMDLDVKPDDPHLKVMHKIQDYLVEQHANGKRVVMFVEEAQSMPIETLEEMRLLSNLETKQDKLLQIVLFGQPELDENLSEQRIRQLKERITYSFNLAPLEEYEVRDYINTRMRTSGYQGMDLFDAKAIKEIWKHSGGLLRRINIIADKSCLAAFAENDKTVTRKHVKIAIDDSDFADMPSMKKGGSGILTTFAFLILVAIAAGGWWFTQIRNDTDILSKIMSSQPPEEVINGNESPTIAKKTNSDTKEDKDQKLPVLEKTDLQPSNELPESGDKDIDQTTQEQEKSPVLQPSIRAKDEATIETNSDLPTKNENSDSILLLDILEPVRDEDQNIHLKTTQEQEESPVLQPSIRAKDEATIETNSGLPTENENTDSILLLDILEPVRDEDQNIRLPDTESEDSRIINEEEISPYE